MKVTSLGNQRGQLNIASVSIAVLVFLIVLTVYGQFTSTQTNSALMNGQLFGGGVVNLINLLPLILVGSAIIVVVVSAFRLAQ